MNSASVKPKVTSMASCTTLVNAREDGANESASTTTKAAFDFVLHLLRRCLAVGLVSLIAIFSTAPIHASATTTGLRLWLRADTLAPGTQGVGAWTDANGSGITATQNDPLQQPMLVSDPDVFGARPVVRFNGSNVLNLPDGTLPPGDSPYTVMAVIRPFTSPNPAWLEMRLDQCFLWSGNTSGGQANWFSFSVPGMVMNQWWFDDAMTGPAVLRHGKGRGYLLTFTYDRQDGRAIYIDSAMKGSRVSANPRNGAPTNNRIGAGFNGPDYFYGDIAELLIYDHALSHSERVATETYLQQKYGLEPWPSNPEMALWLRADDGPETNANGEVDWWNDRSGNDNSAYQCFPWAKVTLAESAINGRPAVRFNGTGGFMFLPDGTIPSGNSSYTVIGVVRQTGTSGTDSRVLASGVATGGRANHFSVGHDGRLTNTWWYNDLSTQPGVSTVGEPAIVSFVYSNNIGRTIYVAGRPAATSGSTSREGGTANNFLGTWSDYTNYFNGDVAEILVYPRALDQHEREAVECDLAEKYEVALADGPCSSPTMVGEIVGPAGPVAIGDEALVQVSFTDADEEETHAAEWNWGDGTSSAGIVTEPNYATAGNVVGSVAGNHAYAIPGVYTVTLTISDNTTDGGSVTRAYSYIVVYDPEGGFVTGGGWIQSPAGAYPADVSLAGKATFGFTSKYQNGATSPSGNTQFHFATASFRFTSTNYEWLVVSGARAQYKGSGTVNGSGDYGFILTAIDGQITGGGGNDKLRLKVWETSTGEIVYDNNLGASDGADPVTVLGAGSIVIHKP